MVSESSTTLQDMAGEVPYALRLPKELKAELERLSKLSRRSLNSEIIYRLEQSVQAKQGSAGA